MHQLIVFMGFMMNVKIILIKKFISQKKKKKILNLFYIFFSSGKRRYNIKLWKTFTDCFNCLPIAAIIDEKIFCMHGGLSPDLKTMEQIRRIVRPTDIPDTGLLCDLLWSDPDKEIRGWGDNDR